jgi:phospholipid/cholesterol/gamma-HCH transport system substrate-binding protein
MQASKMLEIWVGVFVALGLVGLFFVAMQVSNLGEFRSDSDSYIVKAHFGNIGGLKVRAQVSMAGVTVGRVERIAFDDKNYEAVVEMRIDPAYKTLPEDSSASILTAGLLGEQYIGLTPGGSDLYLKNGDEIELTQSAMVLEQLISRFLFNKAEEGKGDKKAANTADVAVTEPVAGSDAPPPVRPVPAPSHQPVKQQIAKKPAPASHDARHKPDEAKGKTAVKPEMNKKTKP